MASPGDSDSSARTEAPLRPRTATLCRSISSRLASLSIATTRENILAKLSALPPTHAVASTMSVPAASCDRQHAFTEPVYLSGEGPFAEGSPAECRAEGPLAKGLVRRGPIISRASRPDAGEARATIAAWAIAA